MSSEKVLQQKKVIVQELSEKIRSAAAIVFVDHRGLTVEQDTAFRNALRKSGVEYSVVKNTLTRFAARENGLGELDEFFNGPTAMAYSTTDIVSPAKVVVEYAKKFEHLEIKTGVLEGKVVSCADINTIAELPSKEVLISKVLCGLNAPISGFVTVLNANLKGLVVALNAIAEQKQSA